MECVFFSAPQLKRDPLGCATENRQCFLFKDPLFNSSFHRPDPAGRFITVAQLNVVKVLTRAGMRAEARIVVALAAA